MSTSSTNPGTVITDNPNVQSCDFYVIGPALCVLQLNVEGLSAAQYDLLSVLAHQHTINIICLQETYVATAEAGGYSIDGFDLLCHVAHPKYGRATYVQSDIADAIQLMSTEFCDTIQVCDFWLANVYMPPSISWNQQVLPSLLHPDVYIRDFNSHHTDWGYKDGEQLADWASQNDLALIHDAKQQGTFHSSRWDHDYSPDLCWVSSVHGHPQRHACKTWTLRGLLPLN
ncbi:uncharacterized protein LOC123376454 [Mauremys mutica]|uniref:uncharacterized protein LOC123376454 n=1 Tax=Mauremys mutica TaxID=74926 RepID=UPI001D16A235|nr:uncharacterized protein LOC123376454 [Mauremys mutica]XP_044884391.1 uncharacterized protein LOC123376454 [Mauremys mutica]